MKPYNRRNVSWIIWRNAIRCYYVVHGKNIHFDSLLGNDIPILRHFMHFPSYSTQNQLKVTSRKSGMIFHEMSQNWNVLTKQIIKLNILTIPFLVRGEWVFFLYNPWLNRVIQTSSHSWNGVILTNVSWSWLL